LKKYWDDPNFNEERRRKLEIYINYLYNSELLSKTEEVINFVNQKDFVIIIIK